MHEMGHRCYEFAMDENQKRNRNKYVCGHMKYMHMSTTTFTTGYFKIVQL